MIKNMERARDPVREGGDFCKSYSWPTHKQLGQHWPYWALGSRETPVLVQKAIP